MACPKLICPEMPVRRSQLAANIANIIAREKWGKKKYTKFASLERKGIRVRITKQNRVSPPLKVNAHDFK